MYLNYFRLRFTERFLRLGFTERFLRLDFLDLTERFLVLRLGFTERFLDRFLESFFERFLERFLYLRDFFRPKVPPHPQLERRFLRLTRRRR